MAQTIHADSSTTVERVANYETLMPLLVAMFAEFKELSKKKPDGALNKRKVQMVNRLLTDILSLLDDEPTRQYLELLEEDELPQNSDVLLLLSQVEAAMKAFRVRYYRYDSKLRESRWHTK